VLGGGWEEVAGPPAPPADAGAPGLGARRWSVTPGELRRLTAAEVGGSWLAEIGVGVLHADDAAASGIERLWPAVAVPERVRQLHRTLKDRFDPTGRLNPGRHVLVA
ncbi:MAG: FAD-linked oxidase C-terminal domain-containing protein, partial [Acidimicrobiales bacterium]